MSKPQNLDNLMKEMYDEFYISKNVGFSETDFERHLGKKLGEKKAKDFIDKFIK